MKYIDIIQTNSTDPHRRVSSLATAVVDSSSVESGSLKVVGNLPHGYCFRPKTRRDRDNMVEFLKSLRYTS